MKSGKPNLLVLGAGGHGRVVADTARECGFWKEIAFLDDRYPGLNLSGEWKVLGTFQDREKFPRNLWGFLPGVGDNALRLLLIETLRKEGFYPETLRHPRSWVSSGAFLGEGTVLFAQTAVNYGAVIGKGCIVNTGATVDHDCRLEEGVHLSPGVHLAGNVFVGSCAWLGTGAVVLPEISVGSRAVVGAGAVVVKDVPPDILVMGVPAKPSHGRNNSPYSS
ncbi:MAG TPA: acetyltransferase [Synergistaceae bacterium]|nr:acetyltransferase [Synergistaceae bacterium]HPQ38250.1 acetyltransferase [Synergistaceae bacterium]